MTRGPESIFKLAALVAMLAVVALLWTRSRGGEASGQEQAKPALEASAPATETPKPDMPSDQAAPVREVVDATASIAPPSPTLGEYLKNYWGDRWPEMEAKYAEWCVEAGMKEDCLDQPLEVVPPPWESVVAGFQAKLLEDGQNSVVGIGNQVDWPAKGMTDQDVRKCFKVAKGLSVGPSELAAIESIGHKYNAEIQSRSESSKEGILKAVNSLWLAGKFERAPVALPPHHGVMWQSFTVIQDHWCVRVELKHGDYTWLEEGSASLAALKKTRDAEIQSYLDSLP